MAATSSSFSWIDSVVKSNELRDASDGDFEIFWSILDGEWTSDDTSWSDWSVPTRFKTEQTLIRCKNATQDVAIKTVRMTPRMHFQVLSVQEFWSFDSSPPSDGRRDVRCDADAPDKWV